MLIVPLFSLSGQVLSFVFHLHIVVFQLDIHSDIISSFLANY